ncbi:WD40/YVTN/BNR-like repeat-containing protein [Archangium sp.]|uniref:WD40/YVTN/BNR-like repeat-containing protein n=1 Tax=Archangium sp. TaxID=1872627 RepID=UPI002D421658|nr:hypothetical protein [Archangium sp.]HYO53636.1 hypothetical protein [Archangium sp.]
MLPTSGALLEMKPPAVPCWRLLLALLVLQSLPVLAHGGLPETSNVTVRRGHDEDLLVGATFGAVVTRDHGQTWNWICPEAMGVGSWRPERYHWMQGGDIIAASGNALVRSRDGGCTWETHPFFKDKGATSLDKHPTDERFLYLATGKYASPNGVYRSDDGGETWVPTPLQREDVVFTALRVAPSDPRRLYVTGQTTSAPLLFRSDDGGQSWTELPQSLPQLTRPYDLFLMEVSEASPDVLWARVSAQGYSYVLKSEDGGATLSPVLKVADVIYGMEASADGRTVWVATPVRLYRSQNGKAFTVLPLPSGNSCARREGNVLYGCGSSWVHEWALARSSDEGTTWQPLFGLHDIQAPQLCPAGTPTRDVCTPLWPQLAQTLGLSSAPDGGVPPSPDAGTSEQPEQPPASPRDGCSAATGLVPSALLLFALALARQTRRRPDPNP